MLSSAFTPEAAIKVSSTYIRAAELKGSKVQLELLDLDIDESAVSQSVKEAVNNVIEDDEPLIVDVDDSPKGIQGIDY